MAALAVSAPLLSSASASVAGPDWDEPYDAGSLQSSAQLIFGVGSLSSIAGSIRVVAFVGDDVDAQDMFWITIADPLRVPFSAGTAASFGGSATFDTRLWLFDSDGFGLLANDDAGGAQSGFFGSSTDGTGIMISAPGTYLIAVSGAGTEPLDKNGDPLFLFTLAGEVSGPDGPGGGNPIAGWSDDRNDSSGGEYLIKLEGVEFLTPGDLDGSGAIDGADLGVILALWGRCPSEPPCIADLDGNGEVDGADLGVLLGNWGTGA